MSNTLEWVAKKLKQANKVILRFSDGSKTKLLTNNEMDLLMVGYEEMKKSCKKSDNSGKKWLALHMDSILTSHENPSLPICVPLYALPSDINALYFFLHDNPTDGSYESNIPENLQEDLANLLHKNEYVNRAPSEFSVDSRFSLAFESVMVGNNPHRYRNHPDVNNQNSTPNNQTNHNYQQHSDQVSESDNLLADHPQRQYPLIIETSNPEHQHVSFVRQGSQNQETTSSITSCHDPLLAPPADSLHTRELQWAQTTSI